MQPEPLKRSSPEFHSRRRRKFCRDPPYLAGPLRTLGVAEPQFRGTRLPLGLPPRQTEDGDLRILRFGVQRSAWPSEDTCAPGTWGVGPFRISGDQLLRRLPQDYVAHVMCAFGHGAKRSILAFPTSQRPLSDDLCPIGQAISAAQAPLVEHTGDHNPVSKINVTLDKSDRDGSVACTFEVISLVQHLTDRHGRRSVRRAVVANDGESSGKANRNYALHRNPNHGDRGAPGGRLPMATIGYAVTPAEVLAFKRRKFQ